MSRTDGQTPATAPVISRSAAHFAALALFILLVALVSGCNDTSIPADVPQLVVSRQQDFSQKQLFDLGIADVGKETVFYNFSVASTTKEPVHVTRIEYTNPEDFTILSNSIPGTITRDDEAGFEVSFHPSVRGPHESAISVYVDGFTKPFVLHITGEAR